MTHPICRSIFLSAALSTVTALSVPGIANAADAHKGAPAHAAHWTYSGQTGAEKWGGMKEEFSACSFGKEQSPINIRDTAARKAKLDPIKFDYKPSPLKIIDNGHTIQVNYAPGSSITVNGGQYDLLQFHFHKPSEEKIAGKSYAMVAHLVHKNKEGKLAVVGVLIDQGKDGKDNEMLKTLWANLPKETEKENSPAKVSIDVAAFLPEDKNYYTFKGSLTTPPCSEGVNWFVLKSPVQATKAQVDVFGKIYPMNARPIQPVNGREIASSN
jgi:carbonic anhydrase